GPLDAAALAWLRELAARFPPAAHALAVPGTRPMRIRSAEALIRGFWDAIADTLVRTAAAPQTTGSAGRTFARNSQDDAGDVDATSAPPAFRLVLQLRSTADPSLIVDASSLWDQPEIVLARFGAQAETDLLLALRRGAVVWPPLHPVLAQASPSALELDDDAVTGLLGPAAEELAGAGIEVLWPSSLVGDGLKLQAAVTPAPGKVTDAGFGLDALLDFRWQLTLDGELLDEDEITALAEAKRPLVRLRGRWVTLDPA